MEIRWTSKALSDLARLYEFLEPVDTTAAARTVQMLTAAPVTLQANPRIGRRVEAPEPHEVRRLLVGAYELRYEIDGSTIFIVRMFHTREDR
ncbi:type II toxin-antitoxin system RelE/ParE family toxin [Variovorax sp. LjRoot290]|uniref:type II toxin-antitoxin system RelE/ParE family toxin n=1 Tax=unclassified Variovorax TaxID=663243 RepID=UPI003ED0C64B